MHDSTIPDDPPTADASTAGATGEPVVEGTPIVIPVVAESIDVEKVSVDRGGYRITKRVDARDVVVDEPLRHETVDIERRPINRPLADGELPVVRREGDTTIVPVVKEVVVTRKRLVLVEEIHIVRSRGTRRDPQTVTVLEERIEIERLGAETTVIRS